MTNGPKYEPVTAADWRQRPPSQPAPSPNSYDQHDAVHQAIAAVWGEGGAQGNPWGGLFDTPPGVQQPAAPGETAQPSDTRSGARRVASTAIGAVLDFAWRGGRKRKFVTTAAIPVFAVGGYAVANDFTIPKTSQMIAAAAGVSEVNKTVYTLPSCEAPQPIIEGAISSVGGLVLKVNAMTSEDDMAKAAKDPKFKPTLVTGFAEQKQMLPSTPFSTDKTLVARLPATNYGWNGPGKDPETVGIIVCPTDKDTTDIITPQSDGTIAVDASKISIIAGHEGDFSMGYEAYPLAIEKGKEAQSPYTKKELDRQKAFLTAAKGQNPEIMSHIEYGALIDAYGVDGKCNAELKEVVKQFITNLIIKQSGQNNPIIDWNGGFQTPDQNFLTTPNGSLLKKGNAKVVERNTTCGNIRLVKEKE